MVGTAKMYIEPAPPAMIYPGMAAPARVRARRDGRGGYVEAMEGLRGPKLGSAERFLASARAGQHPRTDSPACTSRRQMHAQAEVTRLLARPRVRGLLGILGENSLQG